MYGRYPVVILHNYGLMDYLYCVIGHHSQNMEYATSTCGLFRRRVFRDMMLHYCSILRTDTTMVIESPFFKLHQDM